MVDLACGVYKMWGRASGRSESLFALCECCVGWERSSGSAVWFQLHIENIKLESIPNRQGMKHEYVPDKSPIASWTPSPAILILYLMTQG